MYYTIYKSGTQWYWNLKSANHEIIAHGEGYVSKQGALNAIGLVKASAAAQVFEA